MDVDANTSVAERSLSRLSTTLGGLGSMLKGGVKSAVDTAALGFSLASAGAIGFGVASFQSAARVSEMNKTLEVMAENSKVPIGGIMEQVQGVREMGIEYGTAQQLVAQFMRSNLDSAKATQLARVAQDAAIVTGQNSTETLQEMLYAIQTGNTNLNIFEQMNIRAGEATDKYAKSLGKTAKDLTVTEKQQAIMNAFIEAGVPLAGAYEKAMQEPGKVLRSFPRVFDDIKVAAGEATLKGFGPIILKAYDLAKAIDKQMQPGHALYELIQTLGDVLSDLMGPLTDIIEKAGDFIKALKPKDLKGISEGIKGLGPVAFGAAGALAAFGGTKIPVVGEFLGMMPPWLAGMAGIVLTSKEGQQAFGGLLTALAPVAKEVLAALMPALTRLMESFFKILPSITKFAEAIGGAVADAITTLAPHLPKLTEALGKILDKVAPLIPKFVDLAVKALVPLIDPAMKVLDAMLEMVDPLLKVLDAVSPLIPQIIDLAVKALVPLLDPLTKVAKTIGDALVDAIHDLAPYIEPLGEAFGRLMDALAPLLPDIGDLIADLIRLTVDAIEPLLPQFIKLIDDVLIPILPHISKLVDWLDKLFDKLGPTGVGVILGAGAAFKGFKEVKKAGENLDEFIGKHPLLEKAVDKMKDAIKDKLSGAFDTLKDKIASSGGAQGILGKFGDMVKGPATKAFGALKGGIMSLLPALGSLSMALLTNPITWIVLAVVALGVGFVLLYKKCKPFRDIIDAIGRAIGKAFKWMVDIGKAIADFALGSKDALKKLGPFKSIVEAMVNPIKGFIDAIKGVITFVKGVFTGDWSKAWEGIKQIFGGVLRGLFPLATSIFENFGTQIWDVIKGIGNTIFDAFKTAWDAVVDFFTKIPERLLEGLKALPGLLKEAAQTIIAGFIVGLIYAAIGIWKFWTELVPKCLNLIAGFGAKLAKWIADSFLALMNALAKAAQDVWKFFKELPGNILNLVKSAGTWLVNTGKSLVNGFVNGWMNTVHTVWQFLKDLPGNILNLVKNAATWLVTTGKNLVTGFVNGWMNTVHTVWQFLRDLPGNILNLVRSAGNWLLNTGKDLVTGFVNGWKNNVNNVWQFLRELPGKILNLVTSAANWLLNTGRDVVHGLVNGISNTAQDIWNFFWNLPGQILSKLGNAGSWLIDAGKNILRGLKNGAESVLNEVKDFFGGIGKKIMSWKGPLDYDKRILDPAGKAIMDGLISGVGSQLPELEKMMGTVSDTVAGTRFGVSPPSLLGSTAAAGAMFGTAPPGGVPGTGITNALNIEHAHFSSEVDVDLLTRKMEFAVASNRLT